MTTRWEGGSGSPCSATGLEIQSPGTLANNLGLDDLGSRVATRNEALVSVLMRMPVEGIPGSEERVCFMERRGDGIEIIRSQTRDLGGRLPLFDLPGEAEVRVVIPAAFQEPTPGTVVISVRSGNRPVAGATRAGALPESNLRRRRVPTDRNGEAQVDLHSTHPPDDRIRRLPGLRGPLGDGLGPGRQGRWWCRSIPSPTGGSAIFPEATGDLPGVDRPPEPDPRFLWIGWFCTPRTSRSTTANRSRCSSSRVRRSG